MIMASISEKVKNAKKIAKVNDLVKTLDCKASLDHAGNIMIEGAYDKVRHSLKILNAYKLGKLNAPIMDLENGVSFAFANRGN